MKGGSSAEVGRLKLHDGALVQLRVQAVVAVHAEPEAALGELGVGAVKTGGHRVNVGRQSAVLVLGGSVQRMLLSLTIASHAVWKVETGVTLCFSKAT